MRKPVRGLALLSASALALSMGAAGGSAVAAPAQQARIQVLARHLAGPLSLAVGDDGSAWVTEDFGSRLLHVVPGQQPVSVFKATEKGAEVAAASVSGPRVVFAVSGTTKKVYEMIGGSAARVLANVGLYERRHNPDASNLYGFKGISKSCAAKLPKEVGPAKYHGVVDSHPYSSAISGSTVYIGEAAGNDILSITPGGAISTVAVLPPTRVQVTKARAAALHLPGCTIGLKYGFEPVPTDVEVGPDGWLYVSSLPGGPEDPSLGARGRVYKVNPATGRVVLLARGFVSTVDLAVADNGDVYVAELFTGRIKLIKGGSHTATTFLKMNQPSAIEWTPDFLYATRDALVGAPLERAAGFGGEVVRIHW